MERGSMKLSLMYNLSLTRETASQVNSLFYVNDESED
jgi:hypothetical protein